MAYSLTTDHLAAHQVRTTATEMACSQDGERPPADELQTERKPRVLLTEEEKVKRRAECQRKYYLSHKEALKPQKQASAQAYYQRHREERIRYATERQRRERELIRAAKASLAEGRPLIELVPDCYKFLAAR